MENLEKWRHYMKDIISPDSYIDMGFFWMIAASLQRRVYLGSEERPLFPNLYILLVGKPAVGKGLVIKPVTEVLGFYKLHEAKKIDGEELEESILRITEDNAYEEIMNASGDLKKQRDLDRDPLRLFPIAADSATFEALLQEHAKAIRIFHFRKGLDPKHPYFRNKLYSHSSLNVVLEELSTLFRKHTEDVVNYFMKSYDCGDYKRNTKHQGIDWIPRACLNLIAGTTPDFIKTTFNDKLISEGFASRSIIVFEESNRFNKFDFSEVTEEQLKAKASLILWLRKLYPLFGRVTYTSEAYEYSRYYVEEVLPHQKVNLSTRLEGYYGRKPAHFKKLTMAVHFSHSTSMEIGLEDCEYALALLNNLEIKMDKALDLAGKNVGGSLINKIVSYIRKRGASSFTQIWGEFINEITKEQMSESLNFLLEDNKIIRIEDLDKRITKYAIKQK